MPKRSVVNEKPAQPLDDTAADGSRERDAHRSTSRWSPWLGARPRDGVPASTPGQSAADR